MAAVPLQSYLGNDDPARQRLAREGDADPVLDLDQGCGGAEWDHIDGAGMDDGFLELGSCRDRLVDVQGLAVRTGDRDVIRGIDLPDGGGVLCLAQRRPVPP
jgi:hypothetical protein